MDILPIAWAGYCLSDCGTTYSGTCYHVIWDGTGLEDYGADWLRSGYGFEADYASYAGTNGLDATDMPAGQVIYFDKILEPVQIDDYDLLTFWINTREYDPNGDLNIRIYVENDPNEYILKLSNYLNISRTEVWQKVFVNIEDFNIDPVPVTYVGAISLEATGPMSFYLDDAMFSVGTVSTVTVPIQDAELSTHFTEPPSTTSEELEPSVTQEFTENKPALDTQDMKPNLTSKLDKFPKPTLS